MATPKSARFKKVALAGTWVTAVVVLGPGLVTSANPASPSRGTDTLLPIRQYHEMLTPQQRDQNERVLESIVALSRKPRLDALIDILNGPDFYLARPALIGMGTGAIPPLRRILADRRQNEAVRCEALLALAGLGDISEAVKLAEIEIPRESSIDSTVETRFRRTYLELKVGEQGTPGRVAHLVDLLRQREPYLGDLAREFLIDAGPDAVPALLGVAVDRANEHLARIDAVWSLRWLCGAECVPALAAILQDPREDLRLRMIVARALGDIGEVGAIPDLEQAAAAFAPAKNDDARTYDLRRQSLDAVERIQKKTGPPKRIPIRWRGSNPHK